MEKSTKQKILQFLQDHPESSASEISSSLGLSKTDIQYHLENLIRSGELLSGKLPAKQKSGRPTLYYKIAPPALTGNAGRLLDALLYIYLDESAGGKTKNLENLAASLYPALEVIPNTTLRMQSLIRRLKTEGYSPRWEIHAKGPRVIFQTCPFASIRHDRPALCQLDRLILERLSSGKATHEKKIDPEITGSICQFQISFPRQPSGSPD